MSDCKACGGIGAVIISDTHLSEAEFNRIRAHYGEVQKRDGTPFMFEGGIRLDECPACANRHVWLIDRARFWGNALMGLIAARATDPMKITVAERSGLAEEARLLGDELWTRWQRELAPPGSEEG